MKVRDIMKRDPCVSAPGNDLAKAGMQMAEADCGFLPVIGEEERVVGVITDRDVCLALARRDRRPSEVQVRLVMSGEVYTCRADDDIRRALRTMRERRVRRLPVVDDEGRLHGVLSLDDVVLEAQAIETEAFHGPLYADIAQTLKAINFHRTPVPAG